ncbi:protein kinase domain-containing protein [Longimicrobium sp.]|uniref:serine/threonine-protein kinase n=1 Tax=Longimicrobium sp. TaxID=2029185 RepID=UPI003B3B0696
MRRGLEGLMVGRTLAGRYEVVDALARGGMSVVYRGLDRTLGREVGVKVVSLAAASDTALANFRERFRREAASAARIQHPNVVQIFDYGTDPELELDFIVMELLRGRDLKEAMIERPLARPEALRILLDAARGVAAGHRAGIVHRDVKPANVFLIGDGDEIDTVKILDFGIAKPMDDDPEHGLTTIGSLPHSPAYASPEQLDMSAPVTASSDVYQLGLIGFEMLAGRRPFDEEERAAVRAGEDVPLPVTDAWRDLPSGVRGVIQRALRPRPADRYPDAASFAEALTAAQVEDDATAFHPVPVPDEDATELLGAAVPVVTETPAVIHVTPPAVTEAPPAVTELPPAVTEAPPARAVPAEGIPITPPPSTRRAGFPRGPAMWIVPLLLLLAVGLWAATRGGNDDPAPVAAADNAALDTGRIAALDEEFVRLEGVAGRAAVPPPAAQPSGAAGTTPEQPAASVPAQPLPSAPTPPAATPAAVMAQAEAEIKAAVHDLNKAWVEGDIGRHVAHYGSRVDYYNSNNLPRSGVRRDRTRDMRRYDDRRIGLRTVTVQWQAPDRARVLADKEWVFGGDGRTRQGRGMQEYIFKRDEDDGKWYVVSEQLLTTSEARSAADQ